MNFPDFLIKLRTYLENNGIDQDFISNIADVENYDDKIKIIADSSSGKEIISSKSSIIRSFLNENFKKDFRLSIMAKENNNNQKNDSSPNPITSMIKESIANKNDANNKNIKHDNVTDHETLGNVMQNDKTFNSFVVGNNSRFAFNVCQAIAKSPGLDYNPCLLYGGVGLGKTHLAQAIGNDIKNNLGLNVCYMTCGSFLDDYGNAIRTNKIGEYKEMFNGVDVWIVDDIQFLEDKPGMQEGFFNIFNTLKEKNKQIICTSDRPTNSFKKFEKRLSSRISSGIIAALNAPDEETRYAIIKRKFFEQGFAVEDKYIKYIAEKVITNVRDLESTVTTIIGYSKLINEEVDFKIIKEIIRDKLIDEKESGKIDGELIMETVIENFNINKKDLISKKRTKTIVFQRDCCAFLMNDLTEMTHTEIGVKLGGRDHSTIIHSIDKMKEMYQNDKKTKSIIDNLKEEIKRRSI